MDDNQVNNRKSPKYYVNKYLQSIKDELKGKIVIDIPAGNGVTTEILLSIGANAEPFDLFPGYFLSNNIECRQADILNNIPVIDDYADMVICQEGIEHFSDQSKVFREFNRVMKKNGRLLITTPGYSNLSAKFSHLLFESETNKQMPPNEIDDIWMSDKSQTREIYHGHIFLIGIQKLRLLARLSGFKIKEIRYLRLSKGSLFLFPFFYPVIVTSSWLRYIRCINKNGQIPLSVKKSVYSEQLSININPKNLLNRHTFMVFEKEKNITEVDFGIDCLMRQFGKVM